MPAHDDVMADGSDVRVSLDEEAEKGGGEEETGGVGDRDGLADRVGGVAPWASLL